MDLLHKTLHRPSYLTTAFLALVRLSCQPQESVPTALSPSRAFFLGRPHIDIETVCGKTITDFSSLSSLAFPFNHFHHPAQIFLSPSLSFFIFFCKAHGQYKSAATTFVRC